MKKHLLMIIMTIIIILVAVLTYNLFPKEEPTVEKKVKAEEKVDNYDTVFTKFIEENQIRRLLAIKEYPTNLTFSNAMFDDDMILWALDKSCLALSECSIISSDSLSAEFKNIFNLTNFSYSDYTCKEDNEILYKYNSENKTYQLPEGENIHNHDKTYNYNEPIYIKIDSVKKVGKDYILSLYELYYDLKENKYISADPYGEVKVFEPADYLNEKGEIDSKKVILAYENGFKDNKKDYPIYKYTFRKNDENFYIYKFEH